MVLNINSRDTKGMTSFDALEAIQGEGKLVEVTIAKSAGAEPRKLVMTKTFEEKDPVQTKLVDAGGQKVGYIKLREFNARCKRRVGEAIDELQQQGATRLVLDLRGNGGGVLDGAVGISVRPHHLGLLPSRAARARG
jgi:carboxyl-terminal processing protease